MNHGRAVRYIDSGGTEVIELTEHPIPSPGPGQLLVQVKACGLNRADILQRLGHYPAPKGVPADIPGLEFAGRVAKCGNEATLFSPGDPVMGITAGGAMATHILVHEREAIAVPSGMDLAVAAAIPEVFMTAYDALCVQAKMRPGEVVLIHSVGSGVGTAAIQIASAFGATVIGSSRTNSKLERCMAIGLEHPVLVEDGQFLPQLKDMGIKANIILDTVGAAYLQQNIRALAERGRLLVIGLMGGATGSASLGLLLAKRATIIGSVLRSRPLEEKCTLAQSFAREILPFFECGRFKPVIEKHLPMEQIQEAHALMESNQSFGKIILEWNEVSE